MANDNQNIPEEGPKRGYRQFRRQDSGEAWGLYQGRKKNFDRDQQAFGKRDLYKEFGAGGNYGQYSKDREKFYADQVTRKNESPEEKQKRADEARGREQAHRQEIWDQRDSNSNEFRRTFGAEEAGNWEADQALLDAERAEIESPEGVADRFLKGGSFGDGQPEWKGYNKITGEGGMLKKDWQLDGSNLEKGVGLLRDRSMQGMDKLDASGQIQSQRLGTAANLAQDGQARQSAQNFSQIRQKFAGGSGSGELGAIRGSGAGLAARSAPRDQLRNKQRELQAGQAQDRMSQLNKQVGLDKAETMPKQFNIQQSLQERGLEDQAIFDRWSGQKRAYSAEKAGKGIANSAPKQGGVGKVVSKVLGGFGF